MTRSGDLQYNTHDGSEEICGDTALGLDPETRMTAILLTLEPSKTSIGSRLHDQSQLSGSHDAVTTNERSPQHKFASNLVSTGALSRSLARRKQSRSWEQRSPYIWVLNPTS